MKTLVARLIGDESLLPAEHRILNIMLLLGILLTILGSLLNYYMELGTAIIVITLFSSLVFTILYGISIIRKQYVLPALIFMCTCIFLIIPSIWITNGGILGGTTLYIVTIASVIASLFRGVRRFALLGCLLLVTLVLLTIQYEHPLLITGYISDTERYIDVSFGLLGSIIVNSALIIFILNYYNKEYHRSRDYLARIEKQKMENAMNRLDRLNLIGEMAANIGHEVRNPLTTVRGYLQYFSTKKELSRYEEDFDVMIQELDRANSIITEFLSLAKDKNVELASNNLNITIANIYPLLQADAIGAGKTIVLELENIPNILMNENEMRQYILNLVHNGLDAIKYKGTVGIKTYMDEQSVVLKIQDDGEGIPQDILDKLGTPFVTTKDKGTGLGIPICYRIADRHKAEMEVETNSTGTNFLIKFRPILEMSK